MNIIFQIVFVILHFQLGYCGCARAEYEINGECCPMCAPGNRVSLHCTVDTSTTCVPCRESTYIDEPSGLTKCFPCSVCDTGLRVKKACTQSSDTVCEPLEGFFCMLQHKSSCVSAVEHSKCKPGEYIKQTGTAFTDTVCSDCTNGTYSDGSLLSSCQPHSKCDTKYLQLIKPGTKSTDTVCQCLTPVGRIVEITVGVVVVVSIGVLLTSFLIIKKSKA